MLFHLDQYIIHLKSIILYESLAIQTGGYPVETQDLASLQLSCFVVPVRAWPFILMDLYGN